MRPQDILREAKRQLALDLNCDPADFDREEITVTKAVDLIGRRPFSRKDRSFDMVSFGAGTVVSVSEEILAQVRAALEGKKRDELFSLAFLRSLGHYFLPDMSRKGAIPLPPGLTLEWIPAQGMEELYATKGFPNALGYDLASPRPDVLAAVAKSGTETVGIAGASADCAMLWQVGIDVVPKWRGKGIGAALVSQLTVAVLQKGKIPYYGTSSSNIASQKTAIRAGYEPGWVCSYQVEKGSGKE